MLYGVFESLAIVDRQSLETLTILLAPMTPHLAEELQMPGNQPCFDAQQKQIQITN